MDTDNRNYMVFNVSEIDVIDFSQVLQSSAETLRYSVDGTKTFVKWEGSTPSSVEALTTKEGPYSHKEMAIIMNDKEWYKEPKI